MSEEIKPIEETLIEIPKTEEVSQDINIDDLIKEIELENEKRFNSVKDEAVTQAQKGMVKQDTVKDALLKLNEVHQKQLSQINENFNKQLTELKENIVTQKGTISNVGQGNPYSSQAQENYNVWKDQGVSDDAKVDLLIQHIRSGKF